MELDIQKFGGRGARSSNTSLTNSAVRAQVSSPTIQNISFNNRNSMVDSFKQQIDVDLNKAITERQPKPRTGINIDSRKLTINEFNTLRSYALKNGITIQENGVYDYFINYTKEKKKK